MSQIIYIVNAFMQLVSIIIWKLSNLLDFILFGGFSRMTTCDTDCKDNIKQNLELCSTERLNVRRPDNN